MKKLVMLIVVLLASSVVHSEELTATTLRTHCNGSLLDGRAFCIGYLMGVHGTIQVGADNILCDMTATGERLRLTYLNETAKHPEILSENVIVASSAALVSGGVCRLVKRPTSAVSPIS
jgi:hypothetical protein